MYWVDLLFRSMPHLFGTIKKIRLTASGQRAQDPGLRLWKLIASSAAGPGLANESDVRLRYILETRKYRKKKD